MTSEEANKIISEFMGEVSTVGAAWVTKWSGSLDALVPVWEKLGLDQVCLSRFARCSWTSYETDIGFNHAHRSNEGTIQAAAAIATAHAIQELNK